MMATPSNIVHYELHLLRLPPGIVSPLLPRSYAKCYLLQRYIIIYLHFLLIFIIYCA